MWPFPQGLFMPPKTRPRVFTQLKIVFLKPTDRECVWPFPQGLFVPSKTHPMVFSVAKNHVST